MSDHTFNPFLAEKYGISIAVLINTFVFWTRTNAAKKSNFHDDRYWFFGTPEYFCNYFPYFNPRQIQRLLSQCRKLGILMTGNFNKKGYDRTNWYALSDNMLIELNLDKTCLKPNPGLIVPKVDDAFTTFGTMDHTKSGTAIPDTKAVKKEDIKLTNCEPPSLVSFIFSEKLDPKVLSEKLESDPRPDKEFLEVVHKHVLEKSDASLPIPQRVHAVIKLLKKLALDKIHFNYKSSATKEAEIIPGKETLENKRKRLMSYVEDKIKNELAIYGEMTEKTRTMLANIEEQFS